MDNVNPQVMAEVYKRREEAGNKPRLVVQVWKALCNDAMRVEGCRHDLHAMCWTHAVWLVACRSWSSEVDGWC